MKILVPIKRVPDTDQKIRASADGSQVVTDQIPFVVNPFDAIALEEAITIHENSAQPLEIVAVGVGGPDYEEQLRTALAMGANRALRVDCEAQLDPWNTASILQAVVRREEPNLVLMGKQAVDDDANQTGQFLAAQLDWPQATFVSRIELSADEALVDREVDQGLETIRLPLPAVITTDLRLNEPRYASLAGIMKARKKSIEVISCEEMGITIEPRVEVLRHHASETERQCAMVNSVDELVQQLRQDAPQP